MSCHWLEMAEGISWDHGSLYQKRTESELKESLRKRIVGLKRREMERSVSSCQGTVRIDGFISRVIQQTKEADKISTERWTVRQIAATAHLATLLSIAGPGATNIINMQAFEQNQATNYWALKVY